MLGLIVAVPVTLAVIFLVVLAWVGNEALLWILVGPLAILGAALTIFGVRALRPALVSFSSLAILGTLEVAVVIFLLAASRPITGGTITGAVISFTAAVTAFWASYRIHRTRNEPVPISGPPARKSPISISVRKPPANGKAPATGQNRARSSGKRKK